MYYNIIYSCNSTVFKMDIYSNDVASMDFVCSAR